ncbi:hypothetical protein [Streptomyces sp. NRRL S-813]|uniref:hypothetical protein n=1 Tax=Streptomyces sp. NRRL S-813 TaxID=1463919 RepID=UPI00131CA7EC|nr:hypothetical protein [Streptomyces sp. NRRL S-813]
MDEVHRFHPTVMAAGRLVMQGWWESETTARRKVDPWVGEYGSIDGDLWNLESARGCLQL